MAHDSSFLVTGGALRSSFLSPGAGDRDARRAHAPGTEIGRYRILSELGRGGAGIVYKAQRSDGVFEQVVALKIAPASEHWRNVVTQERNVLAQLTHPAIARIFDGGATADGECWLAMEYVDGQPIDEWCEDRKTGWRTCVAMMADICDAVAYAHANLVVHRDLKPGNILVGADGRPRLLDFGVAQQLATDADTATPAAFTPAFASPEQLLGQRTTVATDIYQLGLLAHYLLSLDAPFGDGALPASIPRLARTNLARIIGRATAPQPGARHGTAAELAHDLRDVLGGRPGSSVPWSLSARTAFFVYRQRRMLAACVAVLAIVAAGYLHYASRLADEQRASRLEAQTTQKVGDFFVELLNTPAADAQPGRRLDALLDQAALRLRQSTEPPDVRGALFHALAAANARNDRTDAAIALYDEAIRLRRSLGERGRLALAQSELALAHLHFRGGRIDAADALIAEVEATLAAADQGSARERFLLIAALGEYYSGALQFPRADLLLGQAFAAGKALHSPDSTELVNVRNAQAASLQNQYRMDRARTLSEEIVARHVRLFGAEDARTKDQMLQLARVRLFNGELDEAERHYRGVLDEATAVTGAQRMYPRHSALFHIGEILQYRGRYTEAKRVLQESLDVLADTDWRTGSHFVSDTGALGLLELARGNARGAYAILSLDAAQVESIRHMGEYPFYVLRSVSAVLAVDGYSEELEQRVRKALAQHATNYGSDNYFVARARVALAEVLRTKRDFAGARAELLRARRVGEHGLKLLHPMLIAEIDGALAAMAEADGDGDEARRLRGAAHALLDRTFGAGHPLTAVAAIEVAALAAAPDRGAVERALSVLRAEHDPASPWIARAERLLSN